MAHRAHARYEPLSASSMGARSEHPMEERVAVLGFGAIGRVVAAGLSEGPGPRPSRPADLAQSHPQIPSPLDNPVVARPALPIL